MALRTPTIRLLLRLATVSFLAASGLLTWLSFLRPDVSASFNDQITVATPRTDVQSQRTRNPDDFAPLLNRSLGAPLYAIELDETQPTTHSGEELSEDPELESVPLTPTPVAPSQLTPSRKSDQPKLTGLRLMGTMIEEGGSVAILSRIDGGVQLAKVGDSISTIAGEGKVDKIELQQVTLSIDGQTVMLKVPR